MCVAELVRLRDAASELDAAGIEVVVLTAESRDRAAAGAARHRLPFPVVSDTDGRLMDALGLRHAGGGPSGRDIFYSTAFLLDAEGRVAWSFAPDKFNVRASPQEILRVAGRESR